MEVINLNKYKEFKKYNINSPIIQDSLALDEQISNVSGSTYTTTTRLSVVQNDNSEIKINNHKAKNENPEIKSSFFQNQNSEIDFPENEMLISQGNFENRENENSEIKRLELEKVKRDMVKGYMQLLSNFQN